MPLKQLPFSRLAYKVLFSKFVRKVTPEQVPFNEFNDKGVNLKRYL